MNQTEIQRRANSALAVTAELPLEGSIALDDRESLTLHGRIDRLERGGAGPTITDYKTGDAPGAKEILKGEATQLLAYAMLLGDEGGDAALEYWQLPRARHRGQISAPVHYGELVEAGVPQQLKAALLAMLQAETPFLATPSERDRDYDGISRYDEWAE